MDNNSIFLWAFMIGLVYFGFITIFVLKFRFKYVYGMILPLLVVLFFFVLTIISRGSTNGWEGLAYLIWTIRAFCILIGYLSGWLLVALVKRAEK